MNVAICWSPAVSQGNDEAEGGTVVREGVIKEARFNCAVKVGAVCDGAYLYNPGMGDRSKRIRPGHFWLYSEFQTSLRYLRSYLKKKRVGGEGGRGPWVWS